MIISLLGNLIDKIFLRKRSLIETVNDQLKNISQIQHTRHRSEQCVAGVPPVVATANPEGVCNFMVNVIAGLIALYIPR